MRTRSAVLRALVLLCALVAVVLSFSAPAGAANRTLRVWAFGEEGNLMDTASITDRFEAENPGVEVIVQAIPWSAAHDKLITAVVGGVPPDVCQMGTTWMAEFAAMGALAPLDDFVAAHASVSPERYFEASWQTCAFKTPGAAAPQVWGLPWYVDARVLFYRRDLLEQAGFRGPIATVEDWVRAAEALRAFGKTRRSEAPDFLKYPAILSGSDGGMLVMAAWLFGGEPLNADWTASAVRTPEFRRGFAWYVDFFARGLAPTENIYMGEATAMKNGYTGMFVSGPWSMGIIEREAPEILETYEVTVIPGNPRSVSFVGGSNLVVFRGAREPDLARRFVEFMSRKETQLAFYGITKSLPAVREALDDLAAENPKIGVFRDQIALSRPTPIIPRWEEIAFKMGRQLEAASRGRVTIDQAIENIDAEIAQILAPPPPGLPRWVLAAVALAVLAGFAFWFSRAGGPAKKTAMDAGRFEAPIRIPLLLMAPAFLLLAVFLFLPILAAGLLSLTDWNVTAVLDSSLVRVTGLENYRRILTDEFFWIALKNTAVFSFIGVPATMAIGLLAAVALDQGFIRGRVVFRTGFFLPVVTTMVAVAVVWKFVYNPEFGILNWFMHTIGAEPRNWLNDPMLALPSLIVMAVWKNFGYSMVIFLAGLQGIPKEYYEAARIDGAGAWDRFLHITLPLLAPTTFFVAIMTTIGYLQFFAEPYIMTEGGPDNATLSIVLYMYREGFKFYNLGYASAIAYVLFAIIVFFSFIQILLSRRMEEMAR